MNLTFKKFEDSDSETWEKINLESKNSTFLSSIQWINFQRELGREVEQYLISYQQSAISFQPIGLIYIEIFRRKFVNFAYAPYNPVISSQLTVNSGLSEISQQSAVNNKLNLEGFYSEVKNFMQSYIKEKNLTLFRFDPILRKNYLQNLHKIGFKSSLAPAQAKDTWEINLEQSEEELRSGMSSSTRHNINKLLKSNIDIIKANSNEHVKAFADLMNETTARKGFGNYDYSYFQKQFDALSSKGMTDIYLAKFDGNYLAGALINYYKDTAYYTHGASTSNRELSKMRAPYLLQWTIMNEAKSRGFKKYNMWGILPVNSNQSTVKSPLKGVSDFKRSFGGYEINYVGPLETYNNSLKYLVHRVYDWRVYRNDRY